MENKKDKIQLLEVSDEVTEDDLLIAKTMAKVAMYNITGTSEEPSEFEKRLANREFENMLKKF